MILHYKSLLYLLTLYLVLLLNINRHELLLFMLQKIADATLIAGWAFKLFICIDNVADTIRLHRHNLKYMEKSRI